ncbi:hypothetical protein EMIHUDRAFT_106273 [Emiliania huxleyi CCMP1516]|uniref:Uncharacterized protein n=2 Tax=Emiliania huxleyi TaxID=2903 RepID=A0A0D3I9G9_EMIH1|nr:hypothetical protein EMIHUDRAFT_106273 [Emiliania huxleyi CCMP1516]EOD07904.1 hypothetical protein EMIHUDRAFT_106273 [Emiliania huxleyi CCMP1516]|eukprot:XP_005760333.1 hypothetical protein EMIHUDRAFT_106273 [Emiliania huxleyi CCMP1516]
MADSFDAEVDPTGSTMLLIMPESSPLLEATEFLGWTATTAGSDGMPRKAAPCAAAAPLLARCRQGAAGQQHPGHPQFLALCPLTFALTGSAWSRVLETLGEAGLFAAPLPSSDDLLDVLAAIEIADLSPLEIGPGVVFLRQGESLEPPPRYAAGAGDARLIFVSEKRLGFGTHGASNLCQRWANAKLDLYRDEMDEAESQEEPTPAAERWRAARVKAQRATGQPCVPTRRYEDFGTGPAPTTTFVCAQHRLYAVHMYTDDPVFIVVGVQRALRALRLWRRLTDEMGLVMAIAEKRSLGSWTLWIGVLLIPALGIVVVPRSKLLRAARAIDALLASGLEFHEYRSLCGLLEHLRALTGIKILPYERGQRTREGNFSQLRDKFSRSDSLKDKRVDGWGAIAGERQRAPGTVGCPRPRVRVTWADERAAHGPTKRNRSLATRSIKEVQRFL